MGAHGGCDSSQEGSATAQVRPEACLNSRWFHSGTNHTQRLPPHRSAYVRLLICKAPLEHSAHLAWLS